MKLDAYICDRCGLRKEDGEDMPIGWIKRERSYYDHDGELRAHSVLHFCTLCAKLYVQNLTDREEWQ